MDNNSLVAAEKLDVTVIFSEKGMTKLLDEIQAKVNTYVISTETEQGRKDIASLAYKITRSKTLIDDLGKGVVADWKKKAKIIGDFLRSTEITVGEVRHKLDWQGLKNTYLHHYTSCAVIKAKNKRATLARITELCANNKILLRKRIKSQGRKGPKWGCRRVGLFLVYDIIEGGNYPPPITKVITDYVFGIKHTVKNIICDEGYSSTDTQMGGGYNPRLC